MAQDEPDLSDVIVPTETVRPDRREHAKEPHPVDDDELARRAQHERDITGGGQAADRGLTVRRHTPPPCGGAAVRRYLSDG
jgi:hypothetical protein